VFLSHLFCILGSTGFEAAWNAYHAAWGLSELKVGPSLQSAHCRAKHSQLGGMLRPTLILTDPQGEKKFLRHPEGRSPGS
jgi:hypothetical protein